MVVPPLVTPVDAGTLGMGTPVISTAEDSASLGLSLIAILVPVLVIAALIMLAIVLVMLVRSVRRWRRRRRRASGPDVQLS